MKINSKKSTISTYKNEESAPCLWEGALMGTLFAFEEGFFIHYQVPAGILPE
jgi:hypothetical protein